jgi:hypothetical protein
MKSHILICLIFPKAAGLLGSGEMLKVSRMQKVASAVTKGFIKTGSGQKNEVLKAAGDCIL